MNLVELLIGVVVLAAFALGRLSATIETIEEVLLA